MNARAAAALAHSWAASDAMTNTRRSPREITLFLRRNGAISAAAHRTGISAYYRTLRKQSAA